MIGLLLDSNSAGMAEAKPETVHRLQIAPLVILREEAFMLPYTPLSIDKAGNEMPLAAYEATVPKRQLSSLPPTVRRKLDRLTDYVAAAIAARLPAIDFDDRIVNPEPNICCYQVFEDDKVLAHYSPRVEHGLTLRRELFDNVSDDGKELMANLRPTFEQLGFDHLAESFGGQTVGRPKKRVLISYRSSKEIFAEAVAHRLGREGFVPWFDKWEIKAGDSIVEQIGDGFHDVYAVIILLSAEYPDGNWARKEMHTAITKGITEGLRIIPVLYEDMDIPELLKDLRYVDCRKHNPEAFEIQFRAVIEALNELELNPYR